MPSSSPFRIHTLALALAAGTLLAACGGADTTEAVAPQDDGATSTTAAASAKPSNTQPMPTTPVDLSAFDKLTDAQLRSGHALAIKDGRFVDPAINNAVTYKLAMRHRFGREDFQEQLIDHTTELLVRAELAIKKGDAAERTRFIQLLEAIDPSLPSLPRLKAMRLGEDAWGDTVAQASSDAAGQGTGSGESDGASLDP